MLEEFLQFVLWSEHSLDITTRANVNRSSRANECTKVHIVRWVATYLCEKHTGDSAFGHQNHRRYVCEIDGIPRVAIIGFNIRIVYSSTYTSQ